jgi:hypothetical protein
MVQAASYDDAGSDIHSRDVLVHTMYAAVSMPSVSLPGRVAVLG